MSTSDFLLVRPVELTDATLTSSTVPEAVVSAYSGATTYAAGDRAGTTSGTVQSVYQSLQSANLNHTPASSPTWWVLIGIVYTAYNGGTTYADGDIVSNISTDVHELYESQVGSNTGNALTDITKWLLIGKTNRWKMFDEGYNSQTENYGSIVDVVTLGVIVNNATFLNLDATSVTVVQSVSGWSHTENLVRHEVITWWDWYYEELIYARDITITDIPPYPASTLTITIDNGSNTAKCGVCKLGKSLRLGTTHNDDLERTINDFSQADEDAYGNLLVTEGAYSKRLNCVVQMDEGWESEVARILELYRATALIFIGAQGVPMALIYGFLGPWSVPMASSGRPASIQIKGLI